MTFLVERSAPHMRGLQGSAAFASMALGMLSG